MERYVKAFLISFLVINVIVADVFLFLLWNRKSSDNLDQDNLCPNACNEIIDGKIKNMVIPTVAVVSTASGKNVTPTLKVAIQNPVRKTRSTQYIPIPGTGSTLENVWTDLPGTEFYISTDDYSGLVGAYFEANMKLINGNGFGYLRLFDVTAGIEVWGSEISTNSQSFTSIGSGKLTLRNGNHLYRVQAKSLTADTTVFNSGKIKIIVEN
jgi:hypothetical protein